MATATKREDMNIVIVGHVDHGKSTVIGRLLADTDSLPEGKLDAIRELCRRTSKPFEYAFLLDALKDERAQGITIDAARCFFKTAARNYTILDAPGHIEFLRNMVTGAARASCPLLAGLVPPPASGTPPQGSTLRAERLAPLQVSLVLLVVGRACPEVLG